MGEYGEFLEVEFEEKNVLADGYARDEYESKDFISASGAGLSDSQPRRLPYASSSQKAAKENGSDHVEGS